jgi:O-antigen ligase
MLTRTDSNQEKIHIEALLLAVYFALIPLENVLTASIGGSVNRYIGIVIIAIIVIKYTLPSRMLSVRGFKSILLFFGYAMLSLIWTIGSGNSYPSILINMVICTLAFIQAPLNRRELQLIHLAIVFAGVILSLIMMSGGSSTVVNNISGGRMTLVIGGLEIDNNNLAVSLSICALIAFSLFYENEFNFHAIKIIGLICFIIITIAVFYTGSRGGLLAEIGGLVIYLWKAGHGMNLRTLLIGALAIIVFTFIVQNLLSGGLAERFTLESVISSGGTGRTTIWAHALTTFSKSSIGREFFGYGFGAFGHMQQINWGYYVASHNDFIGVLLELGFVGEIFYIGVWVSLIKHALQHRNWVGLALLVVVMIGSLSLEMLVKKMLWMAWYLVLVPQPEPQIIEDYSIEVFNREEI